MIKVPEINSAKKIGLYLKAFSISLIIFSIIFFDFFTIKDKAQYKLYSISVLSAFFTIFFIFQLFRRNFLINAFTTEGIILGLFILYVILLYLKFESAYSIDFIIYIGVLFVFYALKNYDLKNMQGIVAIIILFFVLYECIISYMQLWDFIPSKHNLYSVTGSFINPGPLAICLASFLPLSVSYYLYNFNSIGLNKYIKLLSTAAIILSLSLIPSARSSSANISLVIGLLIYALYHFKISGYLIKISKIYVFICIVLIALSFAAFLYFLYNYNGSTSGRVLIWKIELDIFLHNSLFGSGFNSFFKLYSIELSKYFSYNRGYAEQIVAAIPEFSFNYYLLTAIEFGLIGLILFLSFFCIVLYKFFRLKVKSKDIILLNGYVCSSIIILISSLGSYPLEIFSLKIAFVFFTAISSNIINSNDFKIFNNTLLSKSLILSIVCLICISSFSYLRTYIPIYQRCSMARNLYSIGDYGKAASIYKNSFKFIQDEPEYLSEYGSSLHQINKNVEAVNVLKKAIKLQSNPFDYIHIGMSYDSLNLFQQAENNYILAEKILPNKLFTKFLLANLYNRSGNDSLSVLYAERIVNYNEKIYSPAVNEIKGKMKKMLELKNTLSIPSK